MTMMLITERDPENIKVRRYITSIRLQHSPSLRVPCLISQEQRTSFSPSLTPQIRVKPNVEVTGHSCSCPLWMVLRSTMIH
jgi:hypothetical protein